ncbi:MAG TPA: efflux transporter outer membrane subunit [Accumulibacter sp.]|uniref:efflux transporter outer membrane subunit n=1 Tax=Accumulibacter sp. TaxID=2053492 RepID=UPI0025D017AF|nr:efflux transporter outer membrane subunit [Accumulibacter sp.]MCM8597757.1 efflux transporter outer membrane subunit [Accumulibacter sp.]MCM8610691.1 efflux transporter outer membrane subunit [Accumulibacter sp.]HNC52562.1 efflux transporter outer membrane subunit [Accumulibacter sp.]
MRKSSLAAALLALSASGCMVGPDYVRPTIETPAAWRLSDESARDLANSRWWQQFDDPVLDELVETALRENKDLRIATARIEEFAGRYGIVRAPLFPQIGATYEPAKQRGSPTTLSRETTVFDSYQAVLTASWEIDIWGRIRRQSEAARAQLLASEDGRRAVILSLVGSVASAYVNLRDLDRQLEIAKATANSRGESYEIFKLRYSGGIISLLELSQNQSQYEEAVATIPVIEKAIAQQENGLSVLLGRNPGPIVRGRNIDQLTLPAVPAGLPSDLLERRPDLQQAEQNLIAANALIGAAKAAYFPTISLTGLFGVSSDNLSSLFDAQSKIWRYAAPISLPIFTGGALAGQVQVAEAQQQQALFAYQKAIQQAFAEVNDALVDQDRTRAQLQSQKRQVDALVQYAATARLRYENGYTSYIEVVDAESRLFNAQLQYTQTQQTQFQAMINLYKAMGGGWVLEADKLATANGPQEDPPRVP